MKKYYTLGEIILVLRKEYNECKEILDKLNEYINVQSGYDNYYFNGILASQYNPDNISRVRLYVEKEYPEILKKLRSRSHKFYTQFIYTAYFDIERKNNGLYGVNYFDIPTLTNKEKYIPNIEIINQEEFSNLIEELFSTDLMQVKNRYFHINNDNINLSFDNAFIDTSLGNNSSISWKGSTDEFKYSTKYVSPYLIEDILSLEIPSDKISFDWLQLLEKHENDFNNEIVFKVDSTIHSKKGILKVADTDNNAIKLVKKIK